MCYTFLVVDDTSFMRKMATDCLKQHGYDVVGEAINGKEAIQKYKDLKPQVVMMDLTMPEMNGIDAIKEIMAIDSDAVILVCSASNQKDMIQEALDAGAVGYLMKPFKPDYMNEIIKRYAEPHLDPPVSDEETGENVELDENNSEMEVDTENQQEPVRDMSVDEVAATIELTPIDVEDKHESVPELKEKKRTSKPLADKKIKFVTSYMCNWEEEVQGENNAYSFTYTENDNNISIEMMDESKEKQSIQLTLDGFRELHDWLEQRLEEGKRMN